MLAEKVPPLSQVVAPVLGRRRLCYLPWLRRTCRNPAGRQRRELNRYFNKDCSTTDRRSRSHTHPTVTLLVEDLRRQRNSIGRLLFFWNILPHPHAVVLITGDVQLSVVHLQSLQEPNHVLLLLLDLEMIIIIIIIMIIIMTRNMRRRWRRP